MKVGYDRRHEKSLRKNWITGSRKYHYFPVCQHCGRLMQEENEAVKHGLFIMQKVQGEPDIPDYDPEEGPYCNGCAGLRAAGKIEPTYAEEVLEDA